MTPDEMEIVAETIDWAVEQRAGPIDRRAEHYEAMMQEQRAALEELAARTAECERLLGIEAREMPRIAYDGLASGDDGVVWDDFDFDQRVRPVPAQRMVDRFKER